MASAVVNSRKALAAQPAYVSNNFQMNSSEVRAEVRLSVETKESFAAYVTGISSVNCRINCTQDTLSSSHACSLAEQARERRYLAYNRISKFYFEHTSYKACVNSFKSVENINPKLTVIGTGLIIN